MIVKTKDKQIICNFDNAIGTRVINSQLIIELINENIYLYCFTNKEAYSLRNDIFAAADKNKKAYILNSKYYQIIKD